MGHTGELALIQQLRNRSGRARGAVRLGIGDDCAIVRPPAGHELLVTTDFTLQGRHFRRDWHPAVSVGHRCLARGLSDIAAMGGRPLACFLSLALPERFSQTVAGKRWISGFSDGLLALGEETGTPLAGGDTAAAMGESILADIVLLGSCPQGTALRRSGARAGDTIYVTGTLGGAAAELKLLQANPRRFRQAGRDCDHPHLYPAPRLRQGDRLRSLKLATAAMDISDGLSTDLHHLCQESGTGAIVYADALPLHSLLNCLPHEEALRLALHGGEDYELLFTARAGTRMPKRIGGVALTRIGEITRGKEILLQTGAGRVPLIAQGWEHAV